LGTTEKSFCTTEKSLGTTEKSFRPTKKSFCTTEKSFRTVSLLPRSPALSRRGATTALLVKPNFLLFGSNSYTFPSWEGCPKGGVGQTHDHKNHKSPA
jgi:hypothetical protein